MMTEIILSLIKIKQVRGCKVVQCVVHTSSRTQIKVLLLLLFKNNV